MRHRIIFCAVVLALPCFSQGPVNFDQVKPGMSKDLVLVGLQHQYVVERTFTLPTEKSPEIYTVTSGQAAVGRIFFDNGVVAEIEKNLGVAVEAASLSQAHKLFDTLWAEGEDNLAQSRLVLRVRDVPATVRLSEFGNPESLKGLPGFENERFGLPLQTISINLPGNHRVDIIIGRNKKSGTETATLTMSRW